MCGIASAEQITDWPHGQRNVIPYDVEGYMYDFEEGENCVEFNNLRPDIATFLTVLGTRPYGTDWPSYVQVGAMTCGNTRCYMKIYPWCGYYPNGTPYEWVFIVNGDKAFSPMTGPDKLGGYWPGTTTHIVFKEDTRYVSFLACTDGNMYVDLYDKRGNRICSETITTTVYRTGTNPSNFTEFSFRSLNTDIVSMKVRGNLNGHHFDDLIVGGAPEYLPDKPSDWLYAVERLKQLIGLNYLEFGTAWDYTFGEYRTAEEMMDDIPDPYINGDDGELEYGVGIDDQDAILFAFNGEGDAHINWWDINRMHKHDFTEVVNPGDQKPGDVFFIDYPYGDGHPDGWFDEIGMVIDPTVDTDGAIVNVIRITPEDGVYYSNTEFINANYGNRGFVEYRRLPYNPKGGHSPYKKYPPNKLI